MSDPASTRRLPLATRMFLLVAGLLLLAIGAAVWVSFRQGAAVAERAVRHALESSATVQQEFASQRLAEVELKVQLIAADAPFVNYISESQGGVPGAAPAGLAETASIYDLLVERQEAFGFDLGMVLDPLGQVLARSDQPEPIEESLAADPFIASAVEPITPISGYWRMGSALYQAAVWPLDQGGDLVGFLIVARAIDLAMAERIRAISDADIAFLLPRDDGIVIGASSLAANELADLDAALRREGSELGEAVRRTGALERSELQLAGSRWVARLRPLSLEGGAEVGSALQLTSLDRAEAGYRAILNTVAVAGLAALLVALPLSLLLARTTLRPLRDMARAAKDAVSGNYQTRFHLEGRDELAELSRAFDSLLSDLRGERDIESYVTHLSRLLPEPGDEPETAGAAGDLPASRWLGGLLLLVDLRSALPTEGERAARQGAVRELLDALAGLAEDHGGQLPAAFGTDALLVFEGDQALVSALHVLRGALADHPGLRAAIGEGELLVEVGAAGRPDIAWGAALHGVERLLAESGAGWLLLSRPLGERLRSELPEVERKVVKGALSGKPYYAVARSALSGLPASPPQPRAPRATASAATVERPAARGGDAQALVPGQRLSGRFRVLSVLGSGGMGVVYKARDLELDDVVALKMLKPDALRDRDQLERLKSEIKLARRITHPNVLRTFDFGEIEGMPFISMEYVRGMTLRYLLQQSGSVPYTAALRIARQLCAGLEAAHDVGVLHRDIKPENLILEASGNAKLMDFGIARPIRRIAPGQTEPGMYVGTPAYSAPEQLAGEDVDHRADIFASGVLLCEMFCGRLPFPGSTTVEIYMAQMQGETPSPRELKPDLPEALDAIILRCLQRRREDRYQSATELGRALSALRA
ncbi:protein kinase domain-containing protein [Pseudomarimonas salicorniae]|uniref:Protein kinase n=1 Tax=Pseudomarimonas salicorniae TaxID=2933270 RepID=A0ABT0GKZ9_9GAMM|nr:protein kinase [Lysobacter sp. CAU 1642]MCK7594705.1 protein kinase [Lysobacter sp. CAU 1642]